MSEANHTPGPWEIVEETDPKVISKWHIAIGQRKIGFFPYKYHYADAEKTCGGYVTDAEMHANARLIAAAPELLSALKALHDRLKECSEFCGISARDAYDSYFEGIATEAIAKAEGGVL